MKKKDLLINGKNHKNTFIFAHGAGAPMDSDWMNQMALQLEKYHIRVVRFEFPYMQKRRLTKKKYPPDRKETLLQTYKSAIELIDDSDQLCIGGKSMGGRIASLLADQLQVSALFLFGFPFHAVKKPAGEKMQHLKSIKTPTLLFQGTRDPMGNKEEVEGYALSKKITTHWLFDGDHSFKPRIKSGYTISNHINFTAKTIGEYLS